MSSSEVEYKCFVGGLAWATTDEFLKQVFSRYGEVTDSQIIMDRWTGRSRGYGFVTFREERAMRDAIEWMDGEELDGRTITVEAVRPRGSDGGGSRGPRYDGGYGGGGGGAFGRWEQSILDLIDDGLNEPRGPRRDGGSGGDGGAHPRRGGGGAYGGGRSGGYGRREGGYGHGRRPALMVKVMFFK